MKKLMMAVWISGCVGCLHTRQVEKGDEGVETKQPEPPQEKQEKPKKAEVPSKPTSSAEARAPAEEGRPELSVSPEGLMLPGGPAQIQQALAKQGYLPSSYQTDNLDKETSAALRKFQADEKLAKTGVPDRQTVRKLGLSVEKIFRSSKDEGPNAKWVR